MGKRSGFEGKTVLVTVGSGTIGSEIVRQLLTHKPRVVRIYSRDETKQAHLRLELPDDAPVRFLIGDIRDRDRLECALEAVDLVFHAAALKHVSSCEYNPFEAVQTNVIGTQNLVQACRETGVARLLFISTDKAVNPVNTMGATKLLAENLLRSSQEWNPRLVLSTVRFGNVLGSRGSLIPMLVHQMEKRREVELTSPEMTRFMMTISDAVNLVLEASRVSRGGELYILKMPALCILDLVEVFIEEYCMVRGWDADSISVRTVGARPGEKVHEELLTAEELPRARELDEMCVIQPATQKAQGKSVLSAHYRSDCCELLSRQEIRELLGRSGVLNRLRVENLMPPVVEEPVH